MKKCNFFILIVILSGCAVQQHPAPISYNHANSRLDSGSSVNEETIATIDPDGDIISSSDNNQSSESVDETPPNFEEDYAIPAANPAKEDSKVIYHEVGSGETIEDIARNYGQSVEQIARLNDLYPPYYVDEFQTLKIKITDQRNNSVASKNLSKVETPQKQLSSPPPVVTPKIKREFINPVDGKILVKFGGTTDYGVNKGINIAAEKGVKVSSASDGKVIYADYDATFGNLIMVKVNNKNLVMAYAHLGDIKVSKGASVAQGDLIGHVGSTGKVKSAQLYFAVREGKTAVDPLKYVDY